MDDFSLLGISPGSSAADIRKAWRRLVRDKHPDHAKDPDKAGSQLAEINAAFDRIRSGKPRVSKVSPGQTFDQDLPRRAGPGPVQATDGSSSRDRASRPRSEGVQHGHRQAEPKASGWGLKRSSWSPQPHRVKPSAAGAPSTSRQDIRLSPAQRQDLEKTLETFKRQEATRRVIQERGAYPDPRRPIRTDRGDMPGFHAADRISFEDNVLRVHMTSGLKPGRNFIAFPSLSKGNNGQIRPGTDIDTLWLKTDASGRGRIRLDESKARVAGGRGISVELCFGEEPSRARSWRETSGAR